MCNFSIMVASFQQKLFLMIFQFPTKKNSYVLRTIYLDDYPNILNLASTRSL